jgi:hypothetical protein
MSDRVAGRVVIPVDVVAVLVLVVVVPFAVVGTHIVVSDRKIRSF